MTHPAKGDSEQTATKARGRTTGTRGAAPEPRDKHGARMSVARSSPCCSSSLALTVLAGGRGRAMGAACRQTNEQQQKHRACEAPHSEQKGGQCLHPSLCTPRDDAPAGCHVGARWNFAPARTWCSSFKIKFCTRFLSLKGFTSAANTSWRTHDCCRI